MSAIGTTEGEVCGRDGCAGVIEPEPVETCSCHLSPPCWAHENQRLRCPACDWLSDRVTHVNDHVVRIDSKNGVYHDLGMRQLDATKIDWHSKSHTHFSMIKEGVYPLGTTIEQVLALVKGTFGGRFEHFGDGKFKYIAYTD